MSLIVHEERGDAEEASDLAKAREIGEALQKHYPNHYWVVSFTGHNLIIRNLAITNAITFATGKEGFGSLLPRDKLGTPKETATTAVRFAGALLEAFGLPRGPWDGRDPVVPADLMGEIRKGKQLRGWH